MTEIFLREYPLNDEMAERLKRRMVNVTGITTVFNYDHRAFSIKDSEENSFTSIIFNSNNTDLIVLQNIYNHVFKNDNNAMRTRLYLKMRKHFHLETGETLITIASYIQSSEKLTEMQLLNKVLMIIENAIEY